MPTIEELCGWIPAPAEVEAILSTLVEGYDVATAAPHLMKGDAVWDGQSDICLWEAEIAVTGSVLEAHKQTIGDCVSHGHGSGVDLLQCIQIFKGKFAGEFIVGRDECYTEAHYGNMREGKRMGYSDGAVGIWAVESLKNHGYTTRNGRKYNGQDAKQWGAKGTPAEIKNQGSERKLAQYILVRDTKEAMNLLWNGYPITVCSNQGFTMRRDENGICEAQGSWAHCMVIIGAILVNGQIIFIIRQSWGANVPSGPTIKNMPNCSFGARESVVQRMFGARDSYALSGIPGFPAGPFNYRV